jgi:protein TonB
MKNALLISLVFHVVVTVLSVFVVRITRVRFVPRDVYQVRLVSLNEVRPPAVEKKEPVVEQKVAPPPEPEVKEEELVPPKPKPVKKKPKPKPKKTVPTTELKKSVEPPEDIEPQPEESVPPAETGDVMLDEDFPFAYYISTMKRKIAAFWRVPASSSGQSKYCRVYFRVGRGGSIQSPAIETPSGDFLFDQAALRAVTQANPLPPLPQGFQDQYLGVHFSFAYEE